MPLPCSGESPGTKPPIRPDNNQNSMESTTTLKSGHQCNSMFPKCDLGGSNATIPDGSSKLDDRFENGSVYSELWFTSAGFQGATPGFRDFRPFWI